MRNRLPLRISLLRLIPLCLIFYSDMKNLIGEASYGICQESFSTTITGLFLWAVLIFFFKEAINFIGTELAKEIEMKETIRRDLSYVV